MKYFILALLCCGFMASQAQKLVLPPKPAYPKLYLNPNPDIIDTADIKRLNDKFYTGKTRQDHMPVLLPYGTGKQITNTGTGMDTTGRIPNLWNKRQQDSTPAYGDLYMRPLYYPPDQPALSLLKRKQGVFYLTPPRKQTGHPLPSSK